MSHNDNIRVYTVSTKGSGELIGQTEVHYKFKQETEKWIRHA